MLCHPTMCRCGKTGLEREWNAHLWHVVVARLTVSLGNPSSGSNGG